MVRRHAWPAELGGRLLSPRIDIIVGTRPEATKLAPVAAALDRRRLPFRLILTGQHPLSAGEYALPTTIAEALIELASSHPLMIDLVLHPNPLVAGTMRDMLHGRPNIRLVEPLPHADMVAVKRLCDFLLSDSGGMQEEAPALGIPLLVLCEKTERPEGVASGNMLLGGTDRRRIVDNVVRLLDPAARAAMGRPAFPFGDGHSAERVAGHIADFLKAGESEIRRLHTG